jgi:hypothetical protein
MKNQHQRRLRREETLTMNGLHCLRGGPGNRGLAYATCALWLLQGAGPEVGHRTPLKREYSTRVFGDWRDAAQWSEKEEFTTESTEDAE